MKPQTMTPGQIIVFDLETWIDDEMIMKEHTAKILYLSIDPLRRHESKCLVMVNGEKYGIPFNRVKKVLPAAGEQISLF
jgi:hypothetical protein